MRNVRWIGLSLVLSSGAMALAQQYSLSTVAGGVPPFTPAPAASASIGRPQRVAIDSGGNVYFSSLNCVFKVDTKGVLTLIAGNSRPGFAGDGGLATKAQLNAPQGIAVDGAGNVYIADTENNRVRVVSPIGVISTVAGNGMVGHGGDGGLATQAQLNLPQGLTLDGSGNLYIADSGNYSIRKLTPGGIISNVAGNGYRGNSGDAGQAVFAQLSAAQDIALDSSGNLYIADTGNSSIREVSSTGTISTFVSPTVSPYIAAPVGIVADASGNLYVADSGGNKVFRVTAQGVATAVVGTGDQGYSGDGGQATKAQLFLPRGVAVDAAGNLYIADVYNSRIRQVSSTGTISTFAGNGTFSFSGDGGPAIYAQLYGPNGAAVDASGNLYIADTQNNRVRKISSDGTISTIAGTGAAGYSGDNGPAGTAQLNSPRGLAVDVAGNLYIADSLNNRIRMVSPSGAITTVAGGGTGGSGDGGPAVNAQLIEPFGVAVDGAGNLYIAEFGASRIRKVSSNGVLTTVAGNGVTGYRGDGGPATDAALHSPWGVAVDASGNLYIADTDNNVIRKVSGGGIITTVAGTGVVGYSGDGGPATQAALVAPADVAVDAAGNLYIADAHDVIRKVSWDGTIVTIAGTGSPGYAGDGGPATSAQLNDPTRVAVDASGNLYVADTGNNAVRQLQVTGRGLVIQAVTNAAGEFIGPIAPGEVVILYGSGLGPAELALYELDSAGLVPTNLGGTRVLFNGTPAPLLYSWATQVAAVVPYTVTGSNAQVVVQYPGQISAALTVPVAASAPGLFTLDYSGEGQAVAINQDGSINSASHPAPQGSLVTLFITGAGQTSPAGVDGLPASEPPPVPNLPVTVTIGGQTAQIESVGGTAGLVGVIEVHSRIPSGIQSGSVPVIVQVGNVPSQSGVTIAASAN